MRIPRRKIYRAFPELDRFDDSTCERFIRRSRGGPGSWIARGLLVLFAAVFGWFFAFTAVVYLQRELWPLIRGLSRPWDFVYTVLWVSAMFLPGPFFGLWARDRLLRGRIRGVIRRRGTCLYCGYSLLGIVVPPDLKITCPECGQITVSSPALHELTIDADGRNIVKDAAAG